MPQCGREARVRMRALTRMRAKGGVWIRWTGMVEWNGGMEWNGLDWNSHAHKIGLVEGLNGDTVKYIASTVDSTPLIHFAGASVKATDTRSSCDSV